MDWSVVYLLIIVGSVSEGGKLFHEAGSILLKIFVKWLTTRLTLESQMPLPHLRLMLVMLQQLLVVQFLWVEMLAEQ
jgi:hypothetical protein